MRKLILVLGAAAMLLACQPRHPSQEAHDSASKAAETERARKNAEQDAIQAERQRNLVSERTKNDAKQASPSKPDNVVPPKR